MDLIRSQSVLPPSCRWSWNSENIIKHACSSRLLLSSIWDQSWYFQQGTMISPTFMCMLRFRSFSKEISRPATMISYEIKFLRHEFHWRSRFNLDSKVSKKMPELQWYIYFVWQFFVLEVTNEDLTLLLV